MLSERSIIRNVPQIELNDIPSPLFFNSPLHNDFSARFAFSERRFFSQPGKAKASGKDRLGRRDKTPADHLALNGSTHRNTERCHGLNTSSYKLDQLLVQNKRFIGSIVITSLR